MAEIKRHGKPGPKPRFGAPGRLVSVYVPAAWHPQLREISNRDGIPVSELGLRAFAATYGLSLEDPGSDPEQPPLPITA